MIWVLLFNLLGGIRALTHSCFTPSNLQCLTAFFLSFSSLLSSSNKFVSFMSVWTLSPCHGSLALSSPRARAFGCRQRSPLCTTGTQTACTRRTPHIPLPPFLLCRWRAYRSMKDCLAGQQRHTQPTESEEGAMSGSLLSSNPLAHKLEV